VSVGATVVSGIVEGGTDAAISVGLTVSFGMMGVVNFAHGG
jgi:branched-subunit amino acid ABC-type transport system permease component